MPNNDTATAPLAFVPGDRVLAYAGRTRYVGTVTEASDVNGWTLTKLDGDRDVTHLLASTLTPLCSVCDCLGTPASPLHRTVHTLMHGGCGC